MLLEVGDPVSGPRSCSASVGRASGWLRAERAWAWSSHDGRTYGGLERRRSPAAAEAGGRCQSSDRLWTRTLSVGPVPVVGRQRSRAPAQRRSWSARLGGDTPQSYPYLCPAGWHSVRHSSQAQVTDVTRKLRSLVHNSCQVHLGCILRALKIRRPRSFGVASLRSFRVAPFGPSWSSRS